MAVGGRGVDFDRGGLGGFEVKCAERNPVVVDRGGLALVHGDGGGAAGVADDEGGVARAVLVRGGRKATFVATVGGDGERERGFLAGAAGVNIVGADVIEVGRGGPFAAECGGFVIDDDALERGDTDSEVPAADVDHSAGSRTGDLERRFEAGAAGAAGELEEAVELAPVFRIHLAGGGAALDGDGGGFADDFAHHADGFHDADGTEGLVGDADIAAGHEEILDVDRVEAAVGNRVAEIAVDAAVVLGDSDKGVVGEFGGVFFAREVEVDAPGAGDAAVGKLAFGDEVLVGEDDVAHDAAGFAGATDVGDPVEFGVGVLGLAVAVLHRVEGAEDGAEIPVADQFKIVDRVFAEAALPKPLAFVFLSHVALAGFRVRKVVHGEVEGPGGLGEGAGGGVVGPDPHVGHAEEVFEFDFVFGAGEGGERAVAGAINKEFAAESFAVAVAGVEGGDGVDAAADGGGGVNVFVEEQGDVFLGADEGFLFGVAEFLEGAGGIFGAVGEFFDHFADERIFAAADEAHGPDADFGGAVAAEDRAVLDEGDFQAHASGGNCAAESAVAAADDDEIEITGGLGRGGEIEGGESPGGERGGIARRWG